MIYTVIINNKCVPLLFVSLRPNTKTFESYLFLEDENDDVIKFREDSQDEIDQIRSSIRGAILNVQQQFIGSSNTYIGTIILNIITKILLNFAIEMLIAMVPLTLKLSLLKGSNGWIVIQNTPQPLFLFSMFIVLVLHILGLIASGNFLYEKEYILMQ
ncbi:hypothetical protein ACJX0J_007907 [Zea mays]